MRKRDIAMATVQSVGTIVLAFAIPAVIVLANNGF
jgi:hypothetical protein